MILGHCEREGCKANCEMTSDSYGRSMYQQGWVGVTAGGRSLVFCSLTCAAAQLAKMAQLAMTWFGTIA